jgi:hypothetical protein
VLADGHWPQSANNVTVLTQWLRAEEPVDHWWNRANPLNNGLGSGGGSGLGSYRSLTTAAYFVARNLLNPAYGYPLVVRDLASTIDPSATARAIWRSQWAAGHYGRGANWSTTPVTSVAAPPSAWASPTRCPIAYPVDVVGPCGSGFTAIGAAWHAGAPAGYRGQELWAFSDSAGAMSKAMWAPTLAPGTYVVSAYVPARFADATVAYVVTDARGPHRPSLDQEPYWNAWAPLGAFTATASARIKVMLVTPAGGADGATYVAADAVRFVRVSRTSRPADATTSVASPRTSRLPGSPESVTAVPGDRSATVTWLAPSKDGGAHVLRYAIASRPGGRSCTAAVLATGVWTCTVHGLANGRTYAFRVRAANRVGPGPASAPSSPVRPVGATTIRLRVAAKRFVVNERVILRAVVGPGAAGGTVLFFEDGTALRGCQASRVVRGTAACSMRLASAARHVVLASFTGDLTLSGAGQDVGFRVQREPTSLHALAAPVQVVPGARLTLRAWRLPGHATGRIRFTTGEVTLCVATVASGGGSCAVRIGLAAGVHLVTARYAGNRDYLASTARTSLRIIAATP